MKKKIILLIVIITSLCVSCKSGVVDEAIPNPIQKELTEPKALVLKETIIDCLATYKIEGIVKSKKKYMFDTAAKIAPYDFAIAWGLLNSSAVNKQIKYGQSGRWYFYECTSDCIVEVGYVAEHSANTHIIPSNKQVLKDIKKINENDHIILEGYLVEVTIQGISETWRSSITRTDTGNKACEIMLVEKVEIIEE